MEWFVGRLIDHVHLRVADFPASRRFYLAVLEALEYPGLIELDDTHLQADELYVEGASDYTSRVHFAFQANSREVVDRFHAVALFSGGTVTGPPGVRRYHSGYYAAFVLAPNGNKCQAVYQGATRRATKQLHITTSLGDEMGKAGKTRRR